MAGAVIFSCTAFVRGIAVQLSVLSSAAALQCGCYCVFVIAVR